MKQVKVPKPQWNYEYMVRSQADEAVFHRQCAALEENIPDLIKERLLQDVDGSDYQYYTLDGARVIVGNDCYLDGVYIRSDVNLLPYFQHQQERKVA
ncbi:MAG: hypothetical protein FWE98_02685 [Oscillospiraceae bacterium]|nr:hypothetical protein [Oscillospiraceae bacterium]